jgi:hypothetical protein
MSTEIELITKANERIRALMALNAELVEALKFCSGVCSGETMSKSALVVALESARAALIKAESQS